MAILLNRVCLFWCIFISSMIQILCEESGLPDITTYSYKYPVYPNFRKVLVPAIYTEYDDKAPAWMTEKSIHELFGYSLYLYQRTNPEESFYVGNRGREGAVFLRYIVDHYDNFPDIAIFVRANPSKYAPFWLERIGCISPNATFMNINFQHLERRTDDWKGKGELWMEQCWRDILQTIWGLDDRSIDFYERLPPYGPLRVTYPCCNQFLVSRRMIRRRPLNIWKDLLQIMNEQEVCHEGDPDYTHLYTYLRDKRKVGPEPSHLPRYGESYIQSQSMEHLAHVIFGHKALEMNELSMDEICMQFLPNCPFSPCTPY